MRQNKETPQSEPDIAVALATLLLNVLTLLALCGGAWALHPFVARPDAGVAFLRDFTMYR